MDCTVSIQLVYIFTVQTTSRQSQAKLVIFTMRDKAMGHGLCLLNHTKGPLDMPRKQHEPLAFGISTKLSK